jgi:hypothetical protein
MPNTFWGEALLHVVDVTNNSPCKANDGVPPVTVWDGTKPDLKSFHPFGCKGYALRQVGGHKLSSKSIECVFLSRDQEHRAWRLYDMENKKIFVSRNVKFDDNLFPFKQREKKEKQVNQSEEKEEDLEEEEDKKKWKKRKKKFKLWCTWTGGAT